MGQQKAPKRNHFKRQRSFFATFFSNFCLGIPRVDLPPLLPTHGMSPHRFGQILSLHFQGSGAALWKLSIQKTTPQGEALQYYY